MKSIDLTGAAGESTGGGCSAGSHLARESWGWTRGPGGSMAISLLTLAASEAWWLQRGGF